MNFCKCITVLLPTSPRDIAEMFGNIVESACSVRTRRLPNGKLKAGRAGGGVGYCHVNMFIASLIHVPIEYSLVMYIQCST